MVCAMSTGMAITSCSSVPRRARCCRIPQPFKILNWNGSGFNTLWSLNDAGFVRKDIQDFPANVNSATATGKSDLLTSPIVPGGPAVFFTRRVIDASTASLRFKPGSSMARRRDEARHWNGINLDVLAVRGVTR